MLEAVVATLDTVRKAQSDKRLMLTGDRQLAGDIGTWLGLSPFAKTAAMAS